MSDLKLTRVETGLPGAEPGSDWSVRCGGRLIARVFLIDAGPQAGQWTWACLWSPCEVGTAASLAAALAQIKCRVTPAKLATLALEPPPWTRGRVE